MTIIGLKELRQNISEIADRAQKGETFTVVRRTKPVFTIKQVGADDLEDTRAWTKDYIAKNRELLESLADK